MSTSGFVPFAARSASPVAPLHLPSRPGPPPRTGVPWLASAVPIVGALGFWAITGSAFALWFALLGPLIAVAGVADGQRTARRARRAADAEAEASRERVRSQIHERHAAERASLHARHPDTAGYLDRRDQIWRPVPERAATVVIGRGAVDAQTRVEVSGDAPTEDTRLAETARTLPDAPVAVPIGTGIAVVGPPGLARAVVRALILQLALAHPPGRLEVVAAQGAEDWVRGLPHLDRPGSMRLVVGRDDEATGDVAVLQAEPGDPLPPRCGLVLTLTGVGRARAEIGADHRDVVVEQVGETQARIVVAELTARARSAVAVPGDSDEPLALGSLRPPSRRRSRDGLSVAIGLSGGAAARIDLVRDGPHAVVTGMTGAGKSELLVSWVLALCATYETSDVTFLLADFKGGTAFDALAVLPHVTGVISDLDAGVAGRAILSLRAEIRHREAVMARAGVRDVAHVDLPRLVIVVDEFAALRDAHPELESLFSDIAARGRALGLHLVLGTQRATGAVRDALLANCPLRVCLRVADRTDSRTVLGVDDAAELPGGDRGRGLAIVRRSADARPERVRIALSDASDVAVAATAAGTPHASWLPELPERITLDELDDGGPGQVIGLLDDPDHQRQETWRFTETDRGVLAVGGTAAGKSTFVQTIAAQVPPRLRYWVGPDPEQAWDALAGWDGAAVVAGTTVLIDDADLVLARFPDEYARPASEALERLVRGAGARGARVVASTHRLSGAMGRLADLFPIRLVLPTASRADHVAAGGTAADHALCRTPGRAVVDGRLLQIALPAVFQPPAAAPAPVWDPPVGVSGFVSRGRFPARERWERTGVRLRGVDDHPDPAASAWNERIVIVGTPEQWLGRPRLLERVRAGGALVVDAACERDLRILTGERTLPPFAAASRGRGWEVTRQGGTRRVTVDPTACP